VTAHTIIQPQPASDPRYADICVRWRELAQTAANIIPTKIPLEPMPGEIKALIDDFDALKKKVDPLVRAIAEYFEAMTGHKIDRETVPVDNVLGDALDGMLTYEIESAAERLADEMQRDAYYARFNHEFAAE